MDEPYLVEPCQDDAEAIDELCRSWRAFGGRMNPGLLRRYDGDFDEWLELLLAWKEGVGIGDEVPQTLYLLKDGSGTILGAASLRHYLNHTHIVDGGHVGYGICPEYRGRGHGTLLLRLSLRRLSAMGVERVLVTCDSDNEASRRVILANGGVLENHALDEDGIPIDRFWIDNARPGRSDPQN